MSHIFKNIFVGDIDDAFRCSLQNNLFTHVLTLDCKPLPKEVQMVKHYLHVYCLDSEHFNILKHLNECLEFMDEGMSAGDFILVHCNAGISRSGSVMIAFLMRHLSLTYADASAYAKKMRPVISPNPGFVEQLKLFEQMGNVVDDSNNLYRQYCLNLFSEMIVTTQNFANSDEILWASDPLVNHTPVSLFKCKACRRPLFKHSNVIKHNVENSTVKMNSKKKFKQFSPHDNTNNNNTNSDVCTISLFIEPVLWMKDSILCLSGKIMCPKCHCKLGSFSWTGDQCSCGKWITPAFHISNSKVET